MIPSHLLVLALKREPHDPGNDNNSYRKGNTSYPCLQISRAICCGPDVRRIHAGQVANTVADGESHRLLLIRLTQGCADPSEKKVVDAKAEADKQVDGKHSSTEVICRDWNNEACNDDALADGYMPSSFVPVARGPGDGNSNHGRKEIRRACQDQGDGSAIAQSLHDGWEEILEANRRQMQVVHEAHCPGSPVDDSVSQASPNTGSLSNIGGVCQDSIVCELSLFWRQPSSRQGIIRQKVKGNQASDDR